MSHPVSQIKAAVASAVTGLPLTGSNVFTSRVHAVQESELPCLLVYVNRDEVEQVLTVGRPAQLLRRAEVVVKAIVQSTESVVDDLIELGVEDVEEAIGADPLLGGLVHGTLLNSIDFEFDDANKAIGSAEMVFQVNYVTAENAPGTLL